MESFKVNSNTSGLNIPFEINHDYDKNDREFGIRNDLQNIALDKVNPIEDNELVTYSLKDQKNWNCRIFFNKYVGLNYLIETALLAEFTYGKRYEKYLNKLNNFFDENVVPTFANSFAYPFYSRNEVWRNNEFLFGNEPYLYNSFMKVDYYDSIDSLNQNLLFSQVVYPNPRYTNIKQTEKNINLLVPDFNFNINTPVYQFQWLDDSYLDTLYVTFSFWDAFNGELFILVPTSSFNNDKKWVFNPLEFSNANLYLAYQLETETFVPYEFDGSSYNVKVDQVDLYELIFDDNFSNKNPKINPLQTIEDDEDDDIESSFNFSLNASTINTSQEIDYYRFNSMGFNIDLLRKEFNNNESDFNLELKNNGTESIELSSIDLTLTSDESKLVNEFRNVSKWNDDEQFIEKIIHNYPLVREFGIPKEKNISNKEVFDFGFNTIRSALFDSGGFSEQKDILTLTAEGIQMLPINKEDIRSGKDNKLANLFAEEFIVKFEKNKKTEIKSGESVPIKLQINLGILYGYFMTKHPDYINGDKVINLNYLVDFKFQSLEQPKIKKESLNINHSLYINTEDAN